MFFLWTVGMTNVGGLVAPERILRNVCSVIPDALQGASNEDIVWAKLVGKEASKEPGNKQVKAAGSSLISEAN